MHKIKSVVTPIEVDYPLGFEPDYQLEHISDWGEEITVPEANTPDGLIPGSYVENGIRHIVVWEPGLESHMRVEKVDGKWQLIDEPVF